MRQAARTATNGRPNGNPCPKGARPCHKRKPVEAKSSGRPAVQTAIRSHEKSFQRNYFRKRLTGFSKVPYGQGHVATHKPPQQQPNPSTHRGRCAAAAAWQASSHPCTRTPYYQRRCGLRACVQVNRNKPEDSQKPRTGNGAGFFLPPATHTQRSHDEKSKSAV